MSSTTPIFPQPGQAPSPEPPSRLLLGPGPSMVHPRVLEAMRSPLLGHLDPSFLSLITDLQHHLRWLFRTGNPFTIAVSGTGSAGMEAVIVNLIEPNDRVIVCVNGAFGQRLCQMVQRCRGLLMSLEAPWGQPISLDKLEVCLKAYAPVKAVAIVHAETSTGVLQPLEDFGPLCHRYGAFSIVDTVTSLGGLPVYVDQWQIDACYSATQKCISCPPGVAPLTLSPTAMKAIQKRRTPCPSWYLDCSLLANYWDEDTRTYHHTAPISMIYALHEALQIIREEGLDARFSRHRLNSQALRAGLEVLGFAFFSNPAFSLPTLHCLRLPDYLPDQPARSRLLNEFQIEVGAGLGPLAGKVWRIGLMGESSRKEYVLRLVNTIETLCMEAHGGITKGQAQAAAISAYENPSFY